MYNFIRFIKEGKDKKELEQVELAYAKNALGRSVSKHTIDYHYGSLYKAYVDRYNAGEGDPDFNEAGAFLHAIYFSQFRAPTNSNVPKGMSLQLIEKHFKNFNKFKEEFEKTAMGIQGSGWVYLARNGEIKTITNHQIKNDIILLIDWWEHAWALDYQADKKKYLENQWKIIDWDKVNLRF